MHYICYVNGVETPIVDGTIPNVPGGRTQVFFLDPQREYQLALDAIAAPNPEVLSRWLEPHGLKAAPL
jgi:hypothetical protein